LPIEIPTLPETIAENETANSGTVVATERSKKPITNSPSLVIREILTEEFITR